MIEDIRAIEEKTEKEIDQVCMHYYVPFGGKHWQEKTLENSVV